MLNVSESACTELQKVINNEANTGKNLILYFMGSGCSGPSLGMTLDESTDGLELLESNGIRAYIDPKLNEYIGKIGDIRIDFITNEQGSGYMIKVGDGSCSKEGCSCS